MTDGDVKIGDSEGGAGVGTSGERATVGGEHVPQETHGEAEWTAVKLAEVETERDKLVEECRKLKTLYDCMLEEMQKEQRKAAAESCELEGRIESLCLEQERVERDAAEWE